MTKGRPNSNGDLKSYYEAQPLKLDRPNLKPTKNIGKRALGRGLLMGASFLKDSPWEIDSWSPLVVGKPLASTFI